MYSLLRKPRHTVDQFTVSTCEAISTLETLIFTYVKVQKYCINEYMSFLSDICFVIITDALVCLSSSLENVSDLSPVTLQPQSLSGLIYQGAHAAHAAQVMVAQECAGDITA